ncbi:MAG: hypothetical protein EOM37_11925 [Proteobacteria bacterium]|nr:hypothetical protein [Pseudomonadota bacterium]
MRFKIKTSQTVISWIASARAEIVQYPKENLTTRPALTCRETSDHPILEDLPTVQVFSILPTEASSTQLSLTLDEEDEETAREMLRAQPLRRIPFQSTIGGRSALGGRMRAAI